MLVLITTAVRDACHHAVSSRRASQDALVTKNMVPGESVYGEKRVSVEAGEVCAT